MSLINQMLQELEQRKASSDATGAFKQMAHPVQAVAVPRKNKVLQYAILGALCIGGAYGMQLLSQRMWSKHAMLALPSSSGVITEASAHTKTLPVTQPIPASAIAPMAVAVTEVEATEPVVSFTPGLEKTLHLSQQSGALAATRSNPSTNTSTPVMVPAKVLVAANTNTTARLDVAPAVQTPEPVQVAIANTTPLSKPALPKQSAPNATEPKALINKSMTPEQKSAHAYQQAISYLQQGRVAEAQDQLTQVLELNPQHDDARQTLVGLLVDNKRLDQATQVLKAGLQINPNQGAYAQTLARLQLDSGLTEEALHTLEKHADVQQPDTYYALMAVVLQKTGQHAQAITRYQQALSRGATTPAWLIGMGVSLQAEGRASEAKQAYQQAQASQLSPELAVFVTQRLKQVQ